MDIGGVNLPDGVYNALWSGYSMEVLLDDKKLIFSMSKLK